MAAAHDQVDVTGLPLRRNSANEQVAKAIAVDIAGRGEPCPHCLVASGERDAMPTSRLSTELRDVPIGP